MPRWASSMAVAMPMPEVPPVSRQIGAFMAAAKDVCRLRVGQRMGGSPSIGADCAVGPGLKILILMRYFRAERLRQFGNASSHFPKTRARVGALVRGDGSHW